MGLFGAFKFLNILDTFTGVIQELMTMDPYLGNFIIKLGFILYLTYM